MQNNEIPNLGSILQGVFYAWMNGLEIEDIELPFESDLPEKRFIVVHEDDFIDPLKLVLRELAKHPRRNYSVFKSVEPWAKLGQLSFIDDPPTAGQFVFGKIPGRPEDFAPLKIQKKFVWGEDKN